MRSPGQRHLRADSDAAGASAQSAGKPDPSALQAPERSSDRFEWLLFFFALLVYAASRFIGLTRFPIFFFCDEALQANLADQLLHNRFRDHTGTLLPPYFLNDQRWAVSLSVYIHLIPVWLFGKSVFVVRATSAAVTVLGAAGAAGALRVLKNRFWWAAPLVLSAMPVFFLHARLGFETAMMASFYACFLCAYLLYRYRSSRYLFATLAFGAATFYAYTAGQGVILVIGVLLLFSDLRYHMARGWKLLAGATLFALLLAVPYARYRHLHPGVVRQQLVVLDSYWTHPIPLSQKIALFGRHYIEGLDPRYWFRPNAELVRHQVKGSPFLPVAYVPLLALGLGTCLWKFRRSPGHRAVLFSPLGVSFSAAAANIQILRLMAIVVPATLLVLEGLDLLYRSSRRLLPFVPVAVACAGVFTVATLRLTQRALAEGPTWYTDYGLYGLQYGSPQVFRAIREILAKSPETEVLLSSTWANNPPEFVSFFLLQSEQSRVKIADIHACDMRRSPMTGKELFVMTPDEFLLARASGKFVVERPARILPYPDGRPGFYFVRLRYVPNVDEIFVADRQARAQMQEHTASLDGQTVTVRHSRLDMGEVSALFDGREDTLARGLEANPIVFELLFPTPRSVERVALALGAMDVARLHLIVTPADGEPVHVEATYRNRPASPRLELVLPKGPISASRVRLEITDVSAGDTSHVEVREVWLR